jgi:hypothetical protein
VRYVLHLSETLSFGASGLFSNMQPSELGASPYLSLGLVPRAHPANAAVVSYGSAISRVSRLTDYDLPLGHTGRSVTVGVSDAADVHDFGC